MRRRKPEAVNFFKFETVEKAAASLCKMEATAPGR